MDKLHEADIAVYSIYADIGLPGGLEKVKGYFGGKTGDFYTNQRNWRQGFRPWRALVDLRTMEILMAEGMQGGRPKQYSLDKMIETCKGLPD